jgi:hypothetical protein
MSTSLREALTSAGFKESRESIISRKKERVRQFKKREKSRLKKNKNGKTIVTPNIQHKEKDGITNTTKTKISEVATNNRRVYRPKVKK